MRKKKNIVLWTKRFNWIAINYYYDATNECNSKYPLFSWVRIMVSINGLCEYDDTCIEKYESNEKIKSIY